MPPPTVISFYTQATPYQLEALNLVGSCMAHGVALDIEAVPCLGSWERNCAYKPFFILKKLKALKRPLVWVDADAVFLRPPDWSIFEGYDFSVRFSDRFSHIKCLQIASGTLFINSTEEALALVQAWCQLMAQWPDPPLFLDQNCLVDALALPTHQAKVLPMPTSYCKIFDLDAEQTEESATVIEQRQASRRFKDFIRK